MRNISTIGAVGVVIAALIAAGCSGGQSDLQKWIETTKKKPGGRIQPLPEVKPYETFVYSSANLRSPFQPQGPTVARQTCGQARGATANFSRAFPWTR